jgi:tripartite-type tricarboxylate transporter receptor subunit TctC
VPGFDAVSFAGICAPGGTPKETVAKLQSEIAKGLNVPDIKERLLRDGIEPVGSTPAEFVQFIEREKAKWSKVVKDSGARVD